MRLWILSSSLLILIIIVLRALLKGRLSFRVQYAMWLIVLLRLLIPFSIGKSPVSMEKIIPTTPVIVQQQQQVESNYQRLATMLTILQTEQAEHQTVSNETSTSRPINLAEHLQRIWMIGSIVILLAGILSNFHFQRKLHPYRSGASI